MHHYEDKFFVSHSGAHAIPGRVPSVTERGILHGLLPGFMDAGGGVKTPFVGHAAGSGTRSKFDALRRAPLVGVIAWLLSQGLSSTGVPREPRTPRGPLVDCAAEVAKIRRQLEGKEVILGDLPPALHYSEAASPKSGRSSAERAFDLAAELHRRRDHRGPDCRLDIQRPRRPAAWPRDGVDAGRWARKYPAAAGWTRQAHINVLELQTLPTGPRRRLRSDRALGSKIC